MQLHLRHLTGAHLERQISRSLSAHAAALDAAKLHARVDRQLGDAVQTLCKRLGNSEALRIERIRAVDLARRFADKRHACAAERLLAVRRPFDAA